MTDAIVIGSGPNGLVAANVLADAGWSVVVIEAAPTLGGAVQTAELTAPGFRNDVFSAFYPLAAASPALTALRLERHGLQWAHAPAVVAHPRPDGPAAVMHRDAASTAAALDVDAPGDGRAYTEVVEHWRRVADPFLDCILRPFPPLTPAARLVARTRVRGTLDLARLALVPLRRFVEERFDGESARLLFAGNALHADLTPETAGSTLFGWLLVGLGQQHGFPVPVGGAGSLADALVRRAESRGVRFVTSSRVDHVIRRGGEAVGVRTADGVQYDATRAVLADCDARTLFLELVGADSIDPAVAARLRTFQRSSGTFKVDWALQAPVPWLDPTVHGAGTVHVADSLDELTMTAAQLAMGRIPDRPFLVAGQMTTADPTRSPAGTESLWAYTHVPQEVRGDAGPDGLDGRWDDAQRQRFADRMEERIERLAPGFRSSIIARHVMAPADLESRNENLVGGDISGGTAQLHQQLVFRPFAGWGRAETGIPGLYLASASAHPGGGVHGACGANAARAALAHDRLRLGRRR